MLTSLFTAQLELLCFYYEFTQMVKGLEFRFSFVGPKTVVRRQLAKHKKIS